MSKLKKSGEQQHPALTAKQRFYSLKNGQDMRWRRQEQRDFMVLCEADPGVLHYKCWPETIRVRTDTGWDDHTVDFLVDMGRHVMRVDLVRQQALKDSHVEAVADHYRRRGQTYRPYPIPLIYQEPRFANAQALLRGRAVELPAEFPLAVKETIGRGARTLGQLENDLKLWFQAQGRPLPECLRTFVFAAALRGVLRVPSAQHPLSETTPVSL